MFEIGLRPEPAESGFELALAMVQATGFPLRIHVERNRSRPVVKHSQTVGLRQCRLSTNQGPLAGMVTTGA
jgi:hypothetical protein